MYFSWSFSFVYMFIHLYLLVYLHENQLGKITGLNILLISLVIIFIIFHLSHIYTLYTLLCRVSFLLCHNDLEYNKLLFYLKIRFLKVNFLYILYVCMTSDMNWEFDNQTVETILQWESGNLKNFSMLIEKYVPLTEIFSYL